MVDVWWGIVERDGPGQYDLAAYASLLSHVEAAGLKMQVRCAKFRLLFCCLCAVRKGSARLCTWLPSSASCKRSRCLPRRARRCAHGQA